MGAANVLTSCENYDRRGEKMYLRASYGQLYAVDAKLRPRTDVLPHLHAAHGVGGRLLPNSLALQAHVAWAALGVCRVPRRLFLSFLYFSLMRSVGLLIWGWIEWAKTDEETCVGDADINPRTLALASRPLL